MFERWSGKTLWRTKRERAEKSGEPDQAIYRADPRIWAACISLREASGMTARSPANDVYWKSFEFCRNKPALSHWAARVWPGVRVAMDPEEQAARAACQAKSCSSKRSDRCILGPPHPGKQNVSHDSAWFCLPIVIIMQHRLLI